MFPILDSDVEMDYLDVDWESIDNSAIRVTSDSKLRLSNCNITARGLSSGQIEAVTTVNTTVFTRDCEITATNDTAGSIVQAVSIGYGTYEDFNSSFKADGGETGTALSLYDCDLGDARLNGTQMLAEEGPFSAYGARFWNCTVEARHIRAEARGTSSNGLGTTRGNLKLTHSQVISDDRAISHGGTGSEIVFQDSISWSLLKAPNSLVETSNEKNTSVSFSRLENGSVGPGVACAYNVDEDLVDVVCPQ